MRLSIITTAIVAALAVGGVLLASWVNERARTRGAELFEGRTAMQARLTGHTAALPVVATRCVNCHAPPGSGASSPFGGTLDAPSLTTLRSRRHGPPSRFDAPSLCRLLRTGVDAADVVVSPVMPRYELSDTECTDLWKHLSST